MLGGAAPKEPPHESNAAGESDYGFQRGLDSQSWVVGQVRLPGAVRDKLKLARLSIRKCMETCPPVRIHLLVGTAT